MNRFCVLNNWTVRIREWVTHLDAFVVKVMLLLLLLLLLPMLSAQVLDRVPASKAVEVQRGSSMMTCYPGGNTRYIRFAMVGGWRLLLLWWWWWWRRRWGWGWSWRWRWWWW